MALWKINLAVDCDNEQEYHQVQDAAINLSNMRILKGKDIINMLAMFAKYKTEMTQLFRMISQGGVKSLMSAQGMSLLGSLMKKR